jgi:hypothetical protein
MKVLYVRMILNTNCSWKIVVSKAPNGQIIVSVRTPGADDVKAVLEKYFQYSGTPIVTPEADITTFGFYF